MDYLTDFSKPVAVSDALTVFPAGVRHLMPAWDKIPDEFKDRHSQGEWNKVVSAWFFRGLPEDVEFDLKDGIDGDAMMRHLGAVMGSFQPKHEHKEAAVAFLLSQWCNSIKNWETKK
jgi:hypothetical protein